LQEQFLQSHSLQSVLQPEHLHSHIFLPSLSKTNSPNDKNPSLNLSGSFLCFVLAKSFTAFLDIDFAAFFILLLKQIPVSWHFFTAPKNRCCDLDMLGITYLLS